MRDYEFIKKVDLFTAEVINNSIANTENATIDLNGLNSKGAGFAIQYTVTGAGSSVNIYYKASIDGTNYVTPSGAGNIVTGATNAASDIVTFTMPICRFVDFYIEETASAAATVTVTLAVQ